MRHLSQLFLFIHPMPRRRSARELYMEKWKRLIRVEGPNEENAICIFSNSPKQMEELRQFAREQFGPRCVIDVEDNSPETKVLICDDLDRTISKRGRGRHTEWIPYEMMVSKCARRMSEGLRKALHDAGYAFDPNQLQVVSCGQQWGGCATMYSMFISRYLDVTKTPDVRADLSPDAGWPVRARFVERIGMDRHVYLFLFETDEGRPMAQFLDSLRGVWEPPHAACVAIDPEKVELVVTSPNAYFRVQGQATRYTQEGFVADVIDGCHPAKTTILGKEITFDEFQRALAQARIEPRDDRCRIMYQFPSHDPLTMTRDDEGEER